MPPKVAAKPLAFAAPRAASMPASDEMPILGVACRLLCSRRIGIHMWFMFGGVTLAACVAAYIARRSLEREKFFWVLRPIKDSALRFSVQVRKYQIRGLRFATACSTPYALTLKRETWIDRLFKRLGVNAEFSLGEFRFDNYFYLLSDNRQALQVLRADLDLQQQLLTLFASEATALKIQRLHLDGSQLFVECTPRTPHKEGTVLAACFADAHETLIRSIATGFEAKARLEGVASRDPFVLRAAVLLAVSTGLAVLGVVRLLGMDSANVTIDRAELLKLALSVALAIWLGLIVWCVAWLRNSSRAHLVLLELLLVGSFGVAANTYAGIRSYNMEDDGPPQFKYAPILQRHAVSCGKKGRYTCYSVVVDQPQASLETYTVDPNLYTRLLDEKEVAIPYYRGKLGFRWHGHLVPASQVRRAAAQASVE
jgi:hypothetical protein